MMNRIMRRFTVGTGVFWLLMVCLLLWGPLLDSAAARPGITLGFALDGSGLALSTELDDEIGAYLANSLAIPVKVRSFATEEDLYEWLTRYREVDVAWVSKKFLAAEPAGEFYVLAENLELLAGVFRGRIIARQGQSAGFRQQVADVFLG